MVIGTNLNVAKRNMSNLNRESLACAAGGFILFVAKISPGHEASWDKTGPRSRGLAGGTRDVSRPYSSGLGMSRDILPSSAQSGIYKNSMNSISEYK